MAESTKRTVESGERYAALDGLRALAVVAVFLFHGGLMSPELTDHAARFVIHLDTGVQVFFVLSGFLIYRPFVSAHLSERPSPGIRSYATRRFFRIFPAYWLALGVLLLLGSISVHGNPLPYWTLTQTYFRDTSDFGGIAVAWSLVVEVTFYVFVPFWSLLVRKVAGGRALTAELAGIGFLVGVGIIALWFSFFRAPPLAVRVFPASLPSLAAGMLLAVLTARASHDDGLATRLERIGDPAHWWWLAALAVFALQCSVRYGFLAATPGQIVRDQLLRVPVALFLVLPGVFGSGGAIRRGLRWAPVAYVGMVSYGVYLWHTSVQREVYGWTVFPRDLRVVVAFAVTVGIASASWYALERPVQRVTRRRRAAT